MHEESIVSSNPSERRNKYRCHHQCRRGTTPGSLQCRVNADDSRLFAAHGFFLTNTTIIIDPSRTSSASPASRPASSTPRSSTTSPSLTRTAPSLTSRRTVDVLHVINNEAIDRLTVGSGGLDIPSCYTNSAVDINNTAFRLNRHATAYTSPTGNS